MKLTTTINLLAALCISTATAQTACSSVADAIPSCARSCVLAAGSAIGCSSTDYACQCSKSSALGQNALGCVLGACGIPTALAVRASASAVCACVATATNGGRADMAGRAAVTAVPGRMERAPRPIATANV